MTKIQECIKLISNGQLDEARELIGDTLIGKSVDLLDAYREVIAESLFVENSQLSESRGGKNDPRKFKKFMRKVGPDAKEDAYNVGQEGKRKNTYPKGKRHDAFEYGRKNRNEGLDEGQIQELSRSVMGNYVKKATDDMVFKSRNPKNKFKVKQRIKGLSIAARRLVRSRPKRKVNEEDIQELSKNLLGKYVKGAMADYGKQHDTAAIETMSPGSPESGNIAAKAREKTIKRYAGVSRATDKLTGKAKVGTTGTTTKKAPDNSDRKPGWKVRDKMRNESEDIQELSKNLLARYIGKAGQDLADKSRSIGYDAVSSNKDINANSKKLNTKIRKASKREFGIRHAAQKLSGQSRVNASSPGHSKKKAPVG